MDWRQAGARQDPEDERFVISQSHQYLCHANGSRLKDEQLVQLYELMKAIQKKGEDEDNSS